MRASNILSDQIPPLLHSDTGEKALFWMDEFQVNHLPVLKNGNFVGLVSESELLDQSDLDQSLDQYFSTFRVHLLLPMRTYLIYSNISHFSN